MQHEVVRDLPFHELAALVYRDVVAVKHDSRERLQKELVSKKKLEDRERKKRAKELTDNQKKPTSMALLILEHLLAVAKFETLTCFCCI